jgi:arylsulfatase A-like enzyme
MPQDAHSPRALMEAAFVAGLVMAGLDAVLAPIVASPLKPTTTLNLLHLLALPLGAGVLAGVAERAPRLALDLVIAVFAFGFGRDLMAGDRASTMAIAPFLPWGLAVGVILLSRLARRSRFRPLWGAAAFGLYVLSAWPWHGHYHAPRRWLLLFSLIAAVAALRSFRPTLTAKSSRRWFMIFAMLCLFLTSLASLRRQEVAEWAETNTTALGAIAREVSQWRWSRPSYVPSSSPPAAEDLESAAARAWAQRAKAARQGPPAVLVVVIDALREDVVDRDLLGQAVMPRLRRRASKGLRFRRAYAAAPYSLLSLNALFTGVSPGRLLLEAPARPEYLGTRLANEGGETRAAFSRRVTPRTSSFPDPDLGFASRLAFDLEDPSAEELAAALRPRESEAPYLGYLHLMGPHAPYDDPEGRAGPDADPFRRYLAEVARADELLDSVLQKLITPALAARLLLIVTADHGEEFREHGRLFHGHNLYAESIHVPLMMWGPGLVQGEEKAVVSALDLAPTIDQWLDLGSLGRPVYSGRSLLGGLLGANDATWPQVALAELPERGERSFPARASLVTPRWSFTLDDRRDRRYLFDLQEDPGEHHNLMRSRPEIAAALEARLRRLRGRVPPAREVFPEATRYRETAASRAALRSFLARHHETLEIAFLARAIALMGIGALDPADFATARQFENHAAASVRRAAAVVLAREPGGVSAPRRSLASEIEDAIVLAALEESLAHAGDTEPLAEIERARELQYGAVWLAAALRRCPRSPSDAEIDLLASLADSPVPWFRRQLDALVLKRGGEGARERLEAARRRRPEGLREVLSELLRRD